MAFFPGEERRLEALHRSRIVDTPPEDPFGRLMQLAVDILHAPIAAALLVSEDRAWLKAPPGLDIEEMRHDRTFCSHVMLGATPLLVEDALLEPRFAGCPMVTGPPYIRFYAGVPIRTPDGHLLGTFCVLDIVPRRTDGTEIGILARLAAIATDQLDLGITARRFEAELALSRQEVQEHARREAWLQAALESVPAALWVADASGEVRLQSALARARQGDIIGRYLHELEPMAARDPLDDSAGRLAAAMGGAIVRHAETIVGRDGEAIEVETILAPIPGDPHPSGLLGLAVDLTRHEGELQRLRRSQQQLKDDLLTASDLVWSSDAEHRLTVHGLRPFEPAPPWHQLNGRTFWELAQPEPDSEPVLRQCRADMTTHRPVRGLECAIEIEGMATIWLEASGRPLFDGDGRFRGYRGTARDITARRQQQARITEMDRRMRALAGSNIIAVTIGAGDRILEANDAFFRMTGYSEESLADPDFGWRAITPPEWRPSDDIANRQLLELGACRTFEKEYFRKDGSRLPILFSAVLLDQAHFRWIALTQDLSAQKAAEARIRELADRDSLTGLLNRRSFHRRLAEMVEAPPAERRPGALLMIDLDHFKDLNDTLGHAAGDALLRVLAARLLRVVRQTDVVARLGGDEFAILMDGVARSSDVELVVAKVHKLLEQPFSFDKRDFHVHGSIGVTLFPRDGDDPNQLLKNADIALYRSKATGRGIITYFEPLMRVALEARLLLVEELRRALVANEFQLHFQPVRRLVDGSHMGFEALLRWVHPERGLLTPDAFVEVAEQSGLIVPLGRHVLLTALDQLRRWLDQGIEPGWVAINVASAQLRSERFVQELGEALAANRLAPSRVKIEIIENVLLTSGRQALTLRELHQLGVQIALDDFGTGYASLAHLKRFPVDMLKIDRSFIHDIGRDPEDASISRAIIGLAHSLGMSVVAEGVETDEQLDFLRLNGCDGGQGHGIAPPLTEDQVPAYFGGDARG